MGLDGSSVGRGGHSTPDMDPSFKQRCWPRTLGGSSAALSPAREPAWPTKAVRSPLPHPFLPQDLVWRRRAPPGHVLGSDRGAAHLPRVRQARGSQAGGSALRSPCYPEGRGPAGQVWARSISGSPRIATAFRLLPGPHPETQSCQGSR